MRNHIRTRPLGALIGLVAAAALLSGCAESAPTTSPSASASPSTSAPASETPSPGTPPTAEQTAWAGDVCTSMGTLGSDIQGLVTAVTAGGDDVEARLSAQLSVINDSAATVATTLRSVPRGSEDDPERQAVQDSADDFTESLTAVQASVDALEGTTGAARVQALKDVGAAARDSLAALATTTQAIATAAADGSSTIGQAFAAAPECDALTGTP